MHAVSTITAASLPPISDHHDDSVEAEKDEGPFFDLDFCSSMRSSSSSSDEDLDYFIISLHRSRSASPSYDRTTLQFFPPPPLQFCKSERSAKTGLLQLQYKRRSTNPPTLSFGANKKRTKAAAALYGVRPSSTCSLRLFMESPADDDEDDADAGSEPITNTKRGGAPSIKRYLTNISRLLWRSVRRPRPISGDPILGLHRGLRMTPAAPPSHSDGSLAEKEHGIASAIAHCKESFRRESLSEYDPSLLRSQSDPGKCDASSEL